LWVYYLEKGMQNCICNLFVFELNLAFHQINNSPRLSALVSVLLY
jgi:hypothetical protein